MCVLSSRVFFFVVVCDEGVLRHVRAPAIWVADWNV